VDISPGGVRLRLSEAIQEGAREAAIAEPITKDFCVGVQFEVLLDLRRLAPVGRCRSLPESNYAPPETPPANSKPD